MSIVTVPDHLEFSRGRIKSWTNVLSDLSEEAKSLTEALEAHAGSSDPSLDAKLSTDSASLHRSLERSRRSKTAELLPLRKSNIMIDPLPISREKEKVLSRTRPSWLPPKDKKEEKKHLKEYQRMMELSFEAGKAANSGNEYACSPFLDKRRAEKTLSRQCARDDTRAVLLRIWEEHVLPNWTQAVREPRTRELWWRGIASRSRAEVWKRAIGNELALTEATYAKALDRAKNVEKEICMQVGGHGRKEQIWFDAIDRDVDTTFPDLNMFQSNKPLHSALVDVLKAYAMYRSDIGYSHGTHVSLHQSPFLGWMQLLNRLAHSCLPLFSC